MAYNEYYSARDVIVDFIRRDCIGPVSENEVLNEVPLDTYACGILWPQRTSSEHVQYQSQSTADAESEEIPDAGGYIQLEEDVRDTVNEANQYKPSVMAVSFAVSGEARQVSARFTAAMYTHDMKERDGSKYTDNIYTRNPLDSGDVILQTDRCARLSLFNDAAILRLFIRKTLTDGSRLMTVSVENARIAHRYEIEQNTQSLFQCQLTINGNFVHIDGISGGKGSADRQLHELLYRNAHSFAVGHGCSADWDSKSIKVRQIRSSFLPQAAVPQMVAATTERLTCFTMAKWRDEWREEGLGELYSFVDDYRKWYDKQKLQADSLAKSYESAARDVLRNIKTCIDRMEYGIKTLEEDDLAWQAFLYTNEAMARQSARRRNQPVSDVAWYPFQMCYLLMCLSDMVNDESPFRETVDLLWFATGGGKTEAYLSVAAFTIFHRRITQANRSGGVTVLMRYTLRMLTSQQFERAADLICECELIRRRENLPGGEITIGLWVGGEVSPNHTVNDNQKDAEHVLSELRENAEARIPNNPIQLRRCPICGTELSASSGYEIIGGEMRVKCPNSRCSFSDELPVVIVDDDIYTRRPTLLIGTIDKFARITWNDKTGALFATDRINLPPSLLIQDELHLISGPLGSISGLYEMAVDELCACEGRPVKILASTATVSNAAHQIKMLYGRKYFQFPPSGMDANDSFFSHTASKEERPERMYLGLCETGGSLVDAMVRIFGTVSFALQYLEARGVSSSVIDHFWTNVGYFNSLRDLGSADTIILDRVRAYSESLRRNKFSQEAKDAGMEYIDRFYEYGELTSRKSAKEITDIRRQLDEKHYPDKAAYSYILSSNMLSVGIDIGRLGLMTVYGQPKSTSEYIQATSRVGRSNPGLVIVLLRMTRARDKGHFEQFLTDHQALNKTVEPTSVTPFSCRSMDKALHAAFVALVRHRCAELCGNNAASAFRANLPIVQIIREEILEKVGDVAPDSREEAASILDDFIDNWHKMAMCRETSLKYAVYDGQTNKKDAVLVPAETYVGGVFPPTMNSMRNIDTQSGVYMIRR